MLTPAPLAVRVARVLAVPPPLLAYFLIRVPQVTVGGYVPWPEVVFVMLLVMGLVPLWLFWVADLVSWRRERRTATPEQLELTEEQSGFFAGDLAALVDAEAHGRRIPPRFRDVVVHGVNAFYTDDRPTEPLLLTHEFTPASGIRMGTVTGRHRRSDAHPIPPIADVENADAYAQINRTRELPF
jgi:hypothetical protein